MSFMRLTVALSLLLTVCGNDEWLFSQLRELFKADNDTQWPKGEPNQISGKVITTVEKMGGSVSDSTMNQKFKWRKAHVNVCEWISRHHPARADLREKMMERAVELGLFHSKWQWSEVYHEDIAANGSAFFEKDQIEVRWPELAAAIAALEPEVIPVLEKEHAIAIADTAGAKSIEEHPEGLHLAGLWTLLEIGYEKQEGGSRFRCSNTKFFAETCKSLRQFDEALRKAGRGSVSFARFASLHPGTKVVTHTGDGNQRLKLHCGLSNPDNVELRIADLNLVWKPGECLLIDDSFEHDIESSSSQQVRTILELKLEHPDLRKSGWQIDADKGKKVYFGKPPPVRRGGEL